MRSVDPPVGSRAKGREHVHPEFRQAHAVFHVPSAFEIDGWVYLTGVIATTAVDDGEDLTRPYARAFENIAEVLALADCNWGDVVKITSFHLEFGPHLRAMAQVKDRYCRAPHPAWSVIGAASLAKPAGICEIEVIARKQA